MQTGNWYRIMAGYNGSQGSLKTVEPRGNYEQKQIPLTAISYINANYEK
jgi:hypothetical protein